MLGFILKSAFLNSLLSLNLHFFFSFSYQIVHEQWEIPMFKGGNLL